MGRWSHPDISLEELLTLVKGFVDILILASGYQSSGRFAHWDSQNINNAFQWALFFEDVFRGLSYSDDYQDSVEELDSALSKMISNPYFPKGLAHLSSVTLSRARSFIIKHLVHTLPLRDAHLRAFLTATIKMDFNENWRRGNNCLHVYLDKLMLQPTSSNLVSDGNCYMEDSTVSVRRTVPSKNVENCSDGDFTTFTIQELMKRQLAVSCISSVEKGLDILSKAIRQSSLSELDDGLLEEQLKLAKDPMAEEQFLYSVTWDHWRTRNLSYLLDKRTIRLVSGASMIFSAPKIQWLQVFERLDMSTKSSDDDLCETIELLLLGCISSKWTSLIARLMSISYDSLTISTIYNEVRNLILRKYHNIQFQEEMMNSKEKGILEYLEVLLRRQLHQLWKLSPILAAISIPSWSQLFGLYVSELESQFKGDSSKNRCCSCVQDRKEHRDCEVAERIWCIYIFHVRGSHIMCGASLQDMFGAILYLPALGTISCVIAPTWLKIIKDP